MFTLSEGHRETAPSPEPSPDGTKPPIPAKERNASWTADELATHYDALALAYEKQRTDAEWEADQAVARVIKLNQQVEASGEMVNTVLATNDELTAKEKANETEVTALRAHVSLLQQHTADLEAKLTQPLQSGVMLPLTGDTLMADAPAVMQTVEHLSTTPTQLSTREMEAYLNSEIASLEESLQDALRRAHDADAKFDNLEPQHIDLMRKFDRSEDKLQSCNTHRLQLEDKARRQADHIEHLQERVEWEKKRADGRVTVEEAREAEKYANDAAGAEKQGECKGCNRMRRRLYWLAKAVEVHGGKIQGAMMEALDGVEEVSDEEYVVEDTDDEGTVVDGDGGGRSAVYRHIKEDAAPLRRGG